VATHDEDSSLVLVVGFEGSGPARRALAAAGRILRGREGWIEVVYVDPTESGDDDSSQPAADVMQSLGPRRSTCTMRFARCWRRRSSHGGCAARAERWLKNLPGPP
jgi:hypothetical protein